MDSGASERFLARWVRIGWYPFVLCTTVAVAFWQIDSGTSPGLVVAATSLVLIPICYGMERLFPVTSRWRLDPRELRTDFLHMLLSNPIPSALLYGLLTGASGAISGVVGFGLWPMHWPLAAQAGLAVGVAELVNYWIHRGLHESRLWPLHAVHHCSPRMYFMLSMRKHPLQAFVTYGGRFGALWLLGVSEQAFALYTVLVSTNSFLQHSNLRMSTGLLGLVFATPELHRLHHSARVEELNNNYGDSLIVWDRLFGTYLAPGARDSFHNEVGLPEIEVEQSYSAHWRLPFEWSSLHADRDA